MIRRQRFYAVPPEAVWSAICDPALLGDWFDGRVEIDPRSGGSITLDGGRRVGLVEAVIAPRRLEFTWSGLDDPPTTVRITLVPEADGTRVTVGEFRVRAPDAYRAPVGFRPDRRPGASV